MNRGARLLLGCGVAAFLCICVVVLAMLAGGSQLLSMVLGGGPYGVGNRPMPLSSSNDVLAPPTVGEFTRTSASGMAQMGLTAMYEGPGGQVMLLVRLFPSEGAARSSVEAIDEQLEGAGGFKTSVIGDVFGANAVRYVGGGTARMVWNRGAYFFDVQAPDGGTLDDFMNAFPY